jgi:glycosyltransferase involved in cell wall biosynthesis
MRVGVLVPCRNEALVIERKLANLARIAWPPADGPHLLVVVDDGSEDGTAELAREAARRHLRSREDVRVLVVANAVRPGKPGAIQQGLLELAGQVELVLLTDADVVAADGALLALAAAFAEDTELALACGSQSFVRDLAEDGSARSRDLGELRPAAGLYDRASARVRRLESRYGRLFSVHGQWLAWRASLGIAPRLGLAADDLDLMLQVRARASGPRGVRMLGAARFHEVKTPAGDRAEAQALRRARAYVQVLRASRPSGGALDRAQWCFYRYAPLHAPLAAALLALAVPLAAWFFDPRAALAAAALIVVLLGTGAGRRLVRLLATISRANALESRGSLPERWEMAR